MKIRGQLLIIDLLTIIAVILLFHFVEEKKIAALVASFVFLTNSIFIASSYRKVRIVFWVNVIFILAFALPIPILRILYWDRAFTSIYIGSFPADWLHRTSTGFYLVKILTDSIRIKSALKK